MNASGSISVRGRYLYRSDGTRFLIWGIAFPAPPPGSSVDPVPGYISILEQLRTLDLRYNTVRMYRMDPAGDYGPFFRVAEEMGIYVIVPLTSVSGPGVLDRATPAPVCYPTGLYEYGVACLRNFGRYPNVLAGVVGNEVIDGSRSSWDAAPCVRAFARDLKRYMKREMDRDLPLIYAAQDSGFGAAVTDWEMMRLTADYLTCGGPQISRRGSNAQGGGGDVVDVFGVNVESWCSYASAFERNPDGTPGPYFSLWRSLRRASVPVIFTEMGCSHSDFGRDDPDAGGGATAGMRDWAQVPIVLRRMSDAWSGFVAYAYDDRRGGAGFRMFNGRPWDGRKELRPTEDFFSFRDRLKDEDEVAGSSGERGSDLERSAEPLPPPPPLCADVEAELLYCCGVRLYDLQDMPSYYHSAHLVQDENLPKHALTNGQREAGANFNPEVLIGDTTTAQRMMDRPPRSLVVASLYGLAISCLIVVVIWTRQRLSMSDRASLRSRISDSTVDTKYGSITLPWFDKLTLHGVGANKVIP